MLNHTLGQELARSIWLSQTSQVRLHFCYNYLNCKFLWGFLLTIVINPRSSTTNKCFCCEDMKGINPRDKDSSRKRLMTHHDQVRTHIQIGLDDQRSILNYLYQLALSSARTHEELERYWNTLSHEELIVNLQTSPQEPRNQ